MIKLQYLTFKYQTVASCAIYIPTLATAFALVNFDKEHKYDPQVIFNNFEFNTHIAVIIVMGLISLCLSFNPDIFKGFEECLNKVKR